MSKIKFKRGIKDRLPRLSYGEPAFVSDEEELYIGTENGNIKLTNKSEIESINEQLENKANKDYYEVIFSKITPLTIDTKRLQDAINKGAKYIRFPANCKAKMEESILLLNHCRIYGEYTILYKENIDSPFFTNIIQSGGTRIEGVEINNIKFEKKTGDAYHIHLIEPYKCKVIKCDFVGHPNIDGEYIVTNKSGVKFEKQKSDTCFVNYIEDCYFSKANIFMSGTDSYILNNVIWSYTQEEAIRLYSTSNIDISGNQIVGGKVNGAIYADITGSACGVSRIVNNFFDGSYDSIESGIGLNGYFTLCEISKNIFYNQSKSGIKLYNPNGNNIEGNKFTQNNKDGDAEADIVIEYEGNTSFMNSITNNTFNNNRNFSNYLCIKEIIKNGSPTRYNHILNNNIPIGTTYTDFWEGKTSGVVDNNQFRSKKISNKVYLERLNGTISTNYENVTIKYNIHGGSVSLYIHCINSNLTIPAGGELTLCTVPEDIKPFFEVDVVPSEFGKTSKLRLTLTNNGLFKLSNWNSASSGEVIVTNLKGTLTYTLK